jgi:CheY-like chemotaxis protein
LAKGKLEAVGRRDPASLIVILSDINMPGMDGLQLLGEIRQRYPW